MPKERMSDLLSTPPTRAKLRIGGGRSNTDTLTSVVVAAFIIAALWLGRQIFVPIAIAVLLSFVLAPAVLVLRKSRMPRSIAVLIVVTITFSFLFGLGAIMARQISDLGADLPRYQTVISQKIETVRETAAASSFIERASEALRGLGAQLTRKSSNGAQNGGELAPAQQSETPAAEPVPVEVHQPAPGPMEMLQTVASTVLEPLATAGIVMIFVVFILVQREDLRDRMIRLVGGGDLHRTTLALDDAARRLSRFFLAQTALNAGFGLVIGIGLSLIGVPSPVLWGLLAMLMRFVPYVGAVVAAVGPVILAAAVDPGWSMALMTIALFLVLEPLVGHVIEPLLYGHSTGLSPIAVVIAATFWTWLWGPVGLLLATPLTVCLVVLGRHVERLSFLDIVLSDAPALSPPESFYQRMLAGDPSEAAEQAEDFLRKHALVSFYEDIAMPGLLMAQADLRRGLLNEPHQSDVKETICQVIEDLDDASLDPTAPPPEDETQPFVAQPLFPRLASSDLAPAFTGETPILCVAGRSAIDWAAATMLAQLLRKHGVGANSESPDTLAPGRITRLPDSGVGLVCLSYFDADLASAHVRYAVRRLRRRMPDAKVLACFWTSEESRERAQELCRNAGVDFCAASLSDALRICLSQAGRASGATAPAEESETA